MYKFVKKCLSKLDKKLNILYLITFYYFPGCASDLPYPKVNKMHLYGFFLSDRLQYNLYLYLIFPNKKELVKNYGTMEL